MLFRTIWQGRNEMADMSITIHARFDDILEIAKEIGELQTYKLFPDDDMLLISQDDVIEVLKRHVECNQ